MRSVTRISPADAETGFAFEPESSITASTVERRVLRAIVVATATAIDLPVPTESDAAADVMSARIPLVSSAVTATSPPLDETTPASAMRATAPLEPRLRDTMGATEIAFVSKPACSTRHSVRAAPNSPRANA